jgi:paraquat-inducible protein A
MPAIRPFLLLVASVSFGLGISLPLMRLETLYFFSETPSLLAIIRGLWEEGEVALSVLVTAFSIVFPLLKLLAAFDAAFSRRQVPGWAAALGKWSMVDVVLVAIVIFAAKTSGLADAFTQPGVWFFAISSVTVAVASAGWSRR